MLTESTSLLSVTATPRSRAMLVSSSPMAGAGVKIGASATGSTVTARSLLTVSVLVPSVEVALTVKLNDPLKSLGGVMVKPLSSAAVTVTVPSGLTVPADKVAPVGMPLMTMSRTSLSTIRDEVISRSIALSSSPRAGTVVNVGVSAIGSTVTENVSL